MIGGALTEGRLHIRMRGSPAAGPVATSHLPDRSNPSNQPDYPFVGLLFLNVCTRLDG